MKVLQLFFAAALLLLASGCQKAFDYVRDHTGEDLCRIESLEVVNVGNQPSASDSFRSYVTISYNPAGNPVSMIETHNQTPHPPDNNYYFRYDKKNRLTDWILSESDHANDVIIWHRYIYPRPNVVIDSQYEYGGHVSDPAPPPSTVAYGHLLSLDDKGRVVRDSVIYFPIPYNFPASTATYNVQGNLVRTGVTYDNKLNPYRTNYVWMFLQRDFSVNNPIFTFPPDPVLTYSNFNEYSLPQDITLGVVPYVGFQGDFLLNAGEHFIINYSCSIASAPKTF